MTREKAIKIIKEFINGTCLHLVDQEALETLIPELAESEDERIRKAIVSLVYESQGTYKSFAGIDLNDMVAWLEKQKEQKPNIELIQRSWYMEGYHDREFGKEPKWIIKTGEGGPKHELNPRYGQPLAEQKPAEWSEEDKTRRNCCMIYLTNIRDRIEFSQIIGNNAKENSKKEIQKDIDWLKSLPERFVLQPKPEWSEEDEKMLERAIHIIVEYSDIDEEGSEIVQNWLKSLRPQYHGDVTMTEAYKMGKEAGEASHWKPSDEQLRPLEYAIDYFKKKRNDTTYLESLYNDLKKL